MRLERRLADRTSGVQKSKPTDRRRAAGGVDPAGGAKLPPVLAVRIDLTPGPAGKDLATTLVDGQEVSEYSSRGAAYALARRLRDIYGAKDAPVELYSGGRLVGTCASLHGMAYWTVRENDQGIHLIKHVPFVWRGKEEDDQESREPTNKNTGAESRARLLEGLDQGPARHDGGKGNRKTRGRGDRRDAGI